MEEGMTSQRHGCIRVAADVQWDAIVIGAGPAGALAARQAAPLGLRTLLIDAKPFPRDKVCGGFLNDRALAVLRRVGLANDSILASATPVRELELVSGRQRTRIALRGGRIVCRSVFDERLVESATRAGAAFLSGTKAFVEPMCAGDRRIVRVSQNGDQESLQAHVVVCADGLTRSSIRHIAEFATEPAVDSWVGVGAVITNASEFDIGRISMVVARGGYVGLARIDCDQINVAAAVAPAMLSRSSPAGVVKAILRRGNIEVSSGLDHAAWRGTPTLTQRPRCVAGVRLFVIGDAAGFVEPFTGEGMAAALECAVAVTPLMMLTAQNWDASLATRWQAMHQRIVPRPPAN